jgi:lipopolysaccharide transport system permease protein
MTPPTNDISQLPVVIYTRSSQMRTPARLVREMVRDLVASRELAWRLFRRDIAAQYRQSLLGLLWAFIPSVITALIFIVLQKSQIVQLGETDVPYPVFVLVGMLLWQVFSESIQAPLKSVTNARAMLAKINFPREALILSALLVVLFGVSIKAVVLAGVFLFFGMPLTWGLLLAPLAVLMLVVLGFGMGLVVTPLGMLYTDVSSALPTVVQILFFLTPVVYAPPEVFPFTLIMTLNPVSPLLVGARDLITLGAMTDPVSFLWVSGLAVALLLGGWLFYRISIPIIIERMSA